MKKHFYVLALAPLMMAACNFRTMTPGRSYEVKNSTIISKTKIFDYKVDVNKRVEGRAEGKIKSAKITVEFYKSQAIADANMKANCDFLINPIFTIDQQGKYVKVTVQGYAAKYTNERDIEAKDSIHLQLNGIYITPTTPQPEQAKPKRVIGIF